MITDESGAKCPLFQPSVGVKANEAALEKAKKNFRKEYVAWGSQRFSRASQKGHQGSFYGNCDAFTCTIISGLIESRTFISIDGAKVTNPTPEGVMVECYYADVGKYVATLPECMAKEAYICAEIQPKLATLLPLSIEGPTRI